MSEPIYFDSALALQQAGQFYNPHSLRGRFELLLAHSLTALKVCTEPTEFDNGFVYEKL